MPSAHGFIQCGGNGDGLVGTFDIHGSKLYLYSDVKPLSQPFKCSDATLTYDNIALLAGHCKWNGTLGKSEVQINLDGGVSITGRLATAQKSSFSILGAGTWNTTKQTQPAPSPKSANAAQPANPFPAPNAARDPAIMAHDQKLFDLSVPIIAIFGQSGTGKSTFINQISSEKQKVGTGLHSCTSEISVIEAKVNGKRVVVIDTPGIDDTRAGVKEVDVLVSIANYFGTMGKKQIYVTGVLFLHRISDNKFSQTADRVSTMLKNLCGEGAMNQVMLCTTMWDMVSWDDGYARFAQLCEIGAWKEMIESGASTAMISNIKANAKAEAEKIVTRLIDNVRPVEVTIQEEMVRKRLKVVETRAGRVLDEHLREMQAEAERELKEMRDKLQHENEANAARAQEAIRAQELAVERLKAQAEEQTRQRQAEVVQLKREQEKLKREMKEMKDQMRKEGDVSAAKEEELRARGKVFEQLKQQADELLGKGKLDATQLKEERKKAEQAKNETKKKAKKEAAARAAKAKEEASEQLREIKEAKQQVDTLAAGKPQRAKRWGFF